MKRQKKQRHSIAGQRWYEKILDWITSEENFRWSLIFLGAYAAILLFGVYILANILEWSDAADMFLDVWIFIFPFVAIMAMINPWAGGWALWKHWKLQKPILEQVEQHGSRTYDELVSNCMPVKIHLGIDDALEWLLRTREMVLYINEQGENCYRLPTEEDRKRWRQEFLKEWGAKISFEELKALFSEDAEDTVYDIDFSVGENDDFRIGWWKEQPSDTKKNWRCEDGHTGWEFATFQEMIEAEVFDDKPLQAVWDDVILIAVNDCPASEWFVL